MNTDLAIIGAGAAGLFAACHAAERGLPAVLLERRPRPGIKLLMCANNRCNFGHVGSARELLQAYGEPVAQFLSAAVRATTSADVARWFEERGLRVKRIGQRLYPASEKGDDVLHLLTDILRDRQVPVIYNCPVESVRYLKEGGFLLKAPSLELTSRRILLATGGCSYPRTGSMGDAMLFAKELGLAVEPPRAGLVGIQLSPDDPLCRIPGEFEVEEVTASASGISPVPGNLVVENGVLRGSSVYDLTRLLARRSIPLRNLSIDFLPGRTAESLEKRLPMLRERHPGNDELVLNGLGISPRLARALAEYRDFPAAALKEYPVHDARLRPLREAIITVGGLSLEEFDPSTMQCRRLPGLYAAGECLDIDGPTGGYNLEAAFATAALAVRSIASSAKR